MHPVFTILGNTRHLISICFKPKKTHYMRDTDSEGRLGRFRSGAVAPFFPTVGSRPTHPRGSIVASRLVR